jgi:hypothetical protein
VCRFNLSDYFFNLLIIYIYMSGSYYALDAAYNSLQSQLTSLNGDVVYLLSSAGVPPGSTIQPGEVTITPVPSTAWDADIGIGIQNYYGANSAVSVNYIINPAPPPPAAIPYRLDLVRIRLGDLGLSNGGAAIQLRYRTDVVVDTFGSPSGPLGNGVSFRMTGEASFYNQLANGVPTLNTGFNTNNTSVYGASTAQSKGISFGTYTTGMYDPTNVFDTSGGVD